GGLIGYNTRTNYLVVRVSGNKIDFEIREIEIMPSGEHLWQTKNNRPLEKITILEANKSAGFYLVGTATLHQDQKNKFFNRQGYFNPEYEFSTDQAAPVFRKGTRPGIITELPKIVVEP